MLRKTRGREDKREFPAPASMRPQRNAAENDTLAVGATAASAASMRPQRNAAENTILRAPTSPVV